MLYFMFEINVNKNTEKCTYRNIYVEFNIFFCFIINLSFTYNFIHFPLNPKCSIGTFYHRQDTPYIHSTSTLKIFYFRVLIDLPMIFVILLFVYFPYLMSNCLSEYTQRSYGNVLYIVKRRLSSAS